MKTIAEADWVLIHDAVKKVIDTTLSRAEHKKLTDVLARVEHGHARGALLGGRHAANANLGSLLAGGVGVGVWRK